MLAKNSQGAIDERRLRPIYDLLENANNKKAIQEADKVLKKQPNLLCAKALKALALLRMGKEAESTEILESVRKESPWDDATLQGMSMCYSDLNRLDRICELYEAARQAQPKNEDIAINLFSAYVRVDDYKKQQMTALALTKVRSKAQYYFWMATSILLQALSVDELAEYCAPPLCEFKEPYKGKDKLEENITRLRFVDKVVDKMIQEDKVESVGEALMCPVASEALGDHRKALHVLETVAVKTKMPMGTVDKKKSELLIKMGRWAEANALLKKLLLNEPDSWVLVQYYLESIKRIASAPSANHADLDADDSFEKAAVFIERLIDENIGAKKRGPYLAKLELYKRWLLSNGKGVEVNEYVSQLVSYVKEWGHVDCCGRDLAPYLTNLPRHHLLVFLNQIYKEVGLSKGAVPSSPKQLFLHLTNLELVRATPLFNSITPEETSALVSYLLNCFFSTKGKQGDRYILLGVHYLYDAYLSTDSADYLYEALVLLQIGYFFNPTNKQFNLCKVKLFHCLGAAIPAHQAFTSLDVKHMQVDSLGYLHVWPTVISGAFTIAFELLTTSLRFFNNNFKDSLDQVVCAYKFDAFTKIPEFISIKECLNNSLQFRLVRVEHTLNQMLRPGPIHVLRKQLAEVDTASVFKEIPWSRTFDNRDLNVFWFMDSESKRLSRSEVEDSLARELVLLKARCLIGRWIGAAVNLGCKDSSKESGEDTGYESGTSDGSGGLEEVCRDIESLVSAGAPVGRCLVLSDPPPSRLDSILSLLYFQPLLHSARLSTALIADNSNSASEKAQTSLNLVHVYFHEMVENMSKVRRDACSRASLLTTAVLFSEQVALVSLLVRLLESIFSSSSDKKNKKKRDQAEESACWKEEMVADLRRCLITHIELVIDVLRREQEAWGAKPVSTSMSSFDLSSILDVNISKLYPPDHLGNLIQTFADEVTTSITKSHANSLASIISLLTDHHNIFA